MRSGQQKAPAFDTAIRSLAMTNKWKIGTIAALMAAGISAPAFAQSHVHTGSPLPHYYAGNGAEIFGSWGPLATQRSGLTAFARVSGHHARPARHSAHRAW
jgi:hypothetical protein